MTDPRFDPPPEDPPDDLPEPLGDSETAATRRRLHLELRRIRSEASAARLDARAAEIELQLRHLDESTSHSTSPPNGSATESDTSTQPKTWEQVRHWMDRAGFASNVTVGKETSADLDQPLLRFDGAESGRPPGPHAPPRSDATTPSAKPALPDEPSLTQPAPEADAGPDPVFDPDSLDEPDPSTAAEDEPWPIDEDESETSPKRRRSPAALAISTAVHVGVFLILGMIGFQSHTPKDQVALTASASEPSTAEFETVTMENVEPNLEPVEPTEPVESDIEYELSPVGEMMPAELAIDAPPTLAKAMSAMESSSSAKLLSQMSSDSKANIQFCGVDGGGNHFVYLIDSSGSMKEGFESARRELLQSIEALTPKQRFYVVFYDREPDYMRITNPGADEEFSVSATPENKAALRRWAMTISQDRGWAPYEPTRFALNLRPDVIFLLSDGEFPQKFEDMVREENVVENLFGDRKPISIVHTIAYHSKEGESRMQRIAKQNAGQYRYVPKP